MAYYILIIIFNGTPTYMGDYASMGSCVGAEQELTAALKAENPANIVNSRCLGKAM